jgi:hypothetical protein
MKPVDVSRIESSLQITLPRDYRRLLEAFPLQAFAGNSDTAVWDDADRLVELNRELRGGGAGGVNPWPAYFFALGRDAGGCVQAIDLRTNDLWWADRSHLDAASSYKHRETFEQWAAEYFEGLKSDLEGEGGDAAASPQERAALEEKNARANARFSGASIAVVLVIIVALILWKLVR